VAEFPDSGKYAVLLDEGGSGAGQTMPCRTMGRIAATVDYWEGE